MILCTDLFHTCARVYERAHDTSNCTASEACRTVWAYGPECASLIIVVSVGITTIERERERERRDRQRCDQRPSNIVGPYLGIPRWRHMPRALWNAVQDFPPRFLTTRLNVRKHWMDLALDGIYTLCIGLIERTSELRSSRRRGSWNCKSRAQSMFYWNHQEHVRE